MEEAPDMETYNAAPDIDVITIPYPIPILGLVPINAFVLRAAEPVLVDTGHVRGKDEFMPALKSLIDPSELRWLWLTHTDFDHIGSLQQILDEAPQVRVITTFLATGIMSLSNPLPMDRLYFLNPGEKISVGDRTLTAIRPPSFDNPATVGFYDDKSRAFFSSDCFGAVLQSAPHNARDIAESDLKEGQTLWATVDAPWLHKVNEGAFARELDGIRKMEPKVVLSSHLPAAPGEMTDQLLDTLTGVPKARPFVGPDQAGLEEMLKQMTEGPG
jgi:flavorubredoxin